MMSTVKVMEINIKGTGAVTRPAERAIVLLKAESICSTRSAATEDITAAATEIHDMVNDHTIHDENNAIIPESLLRTGP